MKPHMGSGDSGETSVAGGRRVGKDSPQIEALGAIDEASATVGMARSLVRGSEVKELLRESQVALQACAAEVASADGGRRETFDFAAAVKALEDAMRQIGESAPRPHEFLTPGATQTDAALHLARSSVRRAERRVVALRHAGASVPPGVSAYLNRLSDLLFDLAYAESSY